MSLLNPRGVCGCTMTDHTVFEAVDKKICPSLIRAECVVAP